MLHEVASGFPCRWGGCRHVVHVADGSSMTSLFTASDERRQHELASHGIELPRAPYVDDGPRGGLRAVIERARSGPAAHPK